MSSPVWTCLDTVDCGHKAIRPYYGPYLEGTGPILPYKSNKTYFVDEFYESILREVLSSALRRGVHKGASRTPHEAHIIGSTTPSRTHVSGLAFLVKD